MKASTSTRLSAAVLALAAAVGVTGTAADGPASRPMTSLDYWLSHARPADSQPAIAGPAANPLGPGGARLTRLDALPGVVVLSDGRVLAGHVYTTRDKSWEVWVESEKRWRHVPPIVVLSIRAVVIDEKLDKEWRWKEMGSDERIYTGRTRPVRRHEWRFHLIDGSVVTGGVKGQPVWVEYDGTRHGPFVLHERTAGEYGQGLKDLVYVKAVVISRRAMAAGLDYLPKETSRDAGDAGDEDRVEKKRMLNAEH